MGGLSFGLHIALVISFVSLFAWGCEGETTVSSSGGRRPPIGRATGYHVIDVVNGGTLTGVVLWSGPLPEVVHLTVAHDEDLCGETREVSALSVSARGGVRDSVVYLENVAEGRALPPGPFDVSFVGCELLPRVLAVPVGATLTFHHREVEGSAMVHNVHAATLGGAIWADLGLPAPGASASATIPGVVGSGGGVSMVVDDAGHPWVQGYVHSFAHPYFAVTDAEGRFRIAGVPPGQYTLRTWHEGVRAVPGETVSGRPRMSQPLVLSRPVVATAGSETVIDFQLDLAAVEAAGN